MYHVIPTTTTYIPFGVNSVVPELKNVPRPRWVEKIETAAPAFVQLSEDSREAMAYALHLEDVGTDRRHFNYSVKSQRKLLNMVYTLN